MSSPKFVLVGGTWSFDNSARDETAWWHHGPFYNFLIAQGIQPARYAPFIWSSDIDGGFRWPWQREKFRDWVSAAHALDFYIEEVPPQERVVIAHSHGGNVTAFAASKGTYIHRLVTIGTPVRKDMMAVYAQARLNIGQWCHVAVKGDRMQMLGSVFDGHWGIHRRMPMADYNAHIADKAVGHSGILNDPQHFHYWSDLGLLDFIKKTETV